MHTTLTLHAKRTQVLTTCTHTRPALIYYIEFDTIDESAHTYAYNKSKLFTVVGGADASIQRYIDFHIHFHFVLAYSATGLWMKGEAITWK